MKDKILTRVWAVSLFITGSFSAILAILNIIGVTLPDIALRIIGIVQLISTAVLAFTTVKQYVNRAREAAKHAEEAAKHAAEKQMKDKAGK